MSFFGTLWQRMTSSSYGHCAAHPAFDPTCVECQLVRQRSSEETYPVPTETPTLMNFESSPVPFDSTVDLSDSNSLDSGTSTDTGSSFDAGDSGFSGFDGGDSGGGGSSGDF